MKTLMYQDLGLYSIHLPNSSGAAQYRKFHLINEGRRADGATGCKTYFYSPPLTHVGLNPSLLWIQEVAVIGHLLLTDMT